MVLFEATKRASKGRGIGVNRKRTMPEMNTPTIIIALLAFWLVMGLGFLSKYITARKEGKTRSEAWISYEGVLFALSIVVPLLILIYRSISGNG